MFDFDHTPEADEVLLALRNDVVRPFGTPLSDQRDRAALSRANEDRQLHVLLSDMLASLDPRLADFLAAYRECLDAEICVRGLDSDDLPGLIDDLLKAAGAIADDLYRVIGVEAA